MLDYPISDIVDLMRHHLDHKKREQPHGFQTARATPAPSQEVVYRKAGDDWF